MQTYSKMIAPIIQAADPFFSFVTSLLSFPWTIWEQVKQTIRGTVSMNGYTAINPELDEEETKKD